MVPSDTHRPQFSFYSSSTRLRHPVFEHFAMGYPSDLTSAALLAQEMSSFSGCTRRATVERRPTPV
jgi:hypothetical protein